MATNRITDARLDGLEKAVELINSKFDNICAKFNALAARFDAQDAKFDSILQELRELQEGR